MGHDPGAVQRAFEQAEKVSPPDAEGGQEGENQSPLDVPYRGEGGTPISDDDDGPDLVDDGGPRGSRLPPGFPVQPLGMASGKFHFLTARGEKAELSAGAMNNRANLVALVAGAADPIDQLAAIGRPESKRDQGFCVSAAADRLMEACSDLPLFDDAMEIRHFGTWRGSNGHPIVHLGERLITGPDEPKTGRMVGKALYPAVPSRASPANEICSADDVDWLRKRIQDYWNWGGEHDADIVIGFVGQAALGHYPDWRTHLYIKGKHGNGKSTLLKIISLMLGGMSGGVKNSTSAAAIRQATNRMAYCRIFDEAEQEEGQGIDDVIALFRLMSGSEGAEVERGTSDHSGVRFQLYGAGLFAGIIPSGMGPRDVSRFVMLSLNQRETDGDPLDAAMRLQDLHRDAEGLGASIWARMLSLAPVRWDQTFRLYSGMVQGLGGTSRTGDTIGAILAGWDLMLFDAPLVCPQSGEQRRDRLERAQEIAQPLIDMTQEAEERGEGERFLDTLFGTYINKDHGGAVTAAELIEMLQQDADLTHNNKLLGRLGARVLDGDRGQRELFIINGTDPQLNRAMAGTRWRKGGHTAALDTMPEVKKAKNPVRVAGRAMRGRIIPARFLPGFEDEAPEGGDYDHAL